MYCIRTPPIQTSAPTAQLSQSPEQPKDQLRSARETELLAGASTHASPPLRVAAPLLSPSQFPAPILSPRRKVAKSGGRRWDSRWPQHCCVLARRLATSTRGHWHQDSRIAVCPLPCSIFRSILITRQSKQLQSFFTFFFNFHQSDHPNWFQFYSSSFLGSLPRF